ncbi:MAG: glutathione S-transferase [Deltaproteobacteria bacterium]|nr:glutathione S-transferase [Deltaproteobacteria bacterium]
MRTEGDHLMILHTAPTPNGQKASIALAELGLDYEARYVPLLKGAQFEEAFLSLNPNHKIPVLEDGDQVIWESGAILFYLGEKYDTEGCILPKEPRLRMEALQLSFFQTGGVGPNFGRLGEALQKEGAKNTEMIEKFEGEMERLMGVLERILSDGRPYLLGTYSVADIMHYPWLFIAQKEGLTWFTKKPSLMAWIDRISERPAVQAGMKVPSKKPQ